MDTSLYIGFKCSSQLCQWAKIYSHTVWELTRGEKKCYMTTIYKSYKYLTNAQNYKNTISQYTKA